MFRSDSGHDPPPSPLRDGFAITLRHPSLGRTPWTSDQTDAESSIYQQATLTTERYPCPGGIRTHNPRKRSASDPHLRSSIHCEGLPDTITFPKLFLFFMFHSKSARIYNPSIRATCPAYVQFTALLTDLIGKWSEF
jgi:hypothetical protein